MYLKQLELQGFKSFAKRAVLEFKTPVTAIVGPNGSGKSNIAEAFRYALGEQRMTHMRSKRTEDLIWNGSPKSAKANRASVGLVFDNKDRLLNIDFEEVMLERTIYRDSSTEYRINKTPTRLKDIVELLSGANIGASGHHIISQGETDLILNVNPRERRSMIEDALGLKVHQYKKEESMRKLNAVETNRKEVESLRREIKPHITFLKKQVERIEKTKVMRDELRELYAAYLVVEERYIETEQTRIKEARVPIESRMREIESELARAAKTLASLDHKEIASAAIRTHKAELETILREKEVVTRDLGRIEGSIEALQERIKGVEAREKEEETVLLPRNELQEFRREVEELLSGQHALQELIAAVRSIVTAFVSRHVVRTSQESDGLNKEVRLLEKKREEFAHTIKEKESRIDEIQKKIKALEVEADKEHESLRGAERATYELKSEASELAIALRGLQSEETQIQHAKEDYAREEVTARALVGAVSAQGTLPIEDREAQEKRRREIERLKIKLEDAGGGSGEEVLKEYTEVTDRDAFLVRELADLEKSQETLTALISELDARITLEFKSGVAIINKEFQNFFELMFGGGTASLVVVSEKKRRRSDTEVLFDDGIPEEEEVEEGVAVEVSLPRKKVRGLQMLSGGERALTSIALLFAMSQVKPPPFILLDETDAALDEANSRRYGDMVEALSKRSQLILITHNRETMSRAGVLYGVTMGADGASQLLSVDFAEAVKVAK